MSHLTDEPHRIAKRLSPAQASLLLALDPVVHRDWKALSRNVNTRKKLASLGLVSFDPTGPVICYFMRKQTELGQQVATVLRLGDHK